MSLYTIPSPSAKSEHRHHILKNVQKRKSFNPQVPKDIAENFDLTENEWLQDLLKRVRKTGEKLTLEELSIATNYFNAKYQGQLQELRAHNQSHEQISTLPLVDMVFEKIHKKYFDLKGGPSTEWSAEQTAAFHIPQKKTRKIAPAGYAPGTNLVADILHRFIRSPELGRFEEGTEEAMIEELLVTTGTINQGKSNKFVVLINEQFDELRTMLAIPYEDLIAIQGLRYKINGIARVIKTTTKKINESKKRHEQNNLFLDTRIDIPMRFLLSHYKKYTKELYGLFSYCYQRRRFVPDTEIWAYIKHNELPIHAAHIRMLERLISFKSFAHIRPSYIYFGMETYDQAEGVDYALEHASDIVSKDSILEAQQLLNYLQHRIATINKGYEKQYLKGTKEPLQFTEVFEKLATPRSDELRAYGILPSDIEAYYRLIDGLPVIDLDYLETFIDGFCRYYGTQSHETAAQKATEILDKTYNLRMSEEERQERVEYGMSLKEARSRVGK